ncbi:MAG: hypothetical protein R3D98_02765 [Candidatus Krumholzibacteriia bacterium]
MRTLIMVALVVLLAGTAFAQLENSMGVFFDDASFIPGTTNLNVEPGTEFEMYIVLLNPTVISVAAYECSLEISDPGVFVLGLAGPDATWDSGVYTYPDGFSYGGTNFGDYTNHLFGFQFAVPTYGVAAVLSQMRLLNTSSSTVEIRMGASSPSSVNGAGPAIANGLNVDDIILCTYTSGPDMGGLVATLNGQGIEFPVATEAQSWRGVKSLFAN